MYNIDRGIQNFVEDGEGNGRFKFGFIMKVNILCVL